MALGREVHHRVGVGHQVVDDGPVEDVALDDPQPLVVGDRREVLQVARVGQLVEDDDALGLGAAPGAGQQRAHVVAADEPGSAGDQQLHGDLLSDAIVAAIPETIGVRAYAGVRGHATERSRMSCTW